MNSTFVGREFVSDFDEWLTWFWLFIKLVDDTADNESDHAG